MQRIDPTTHVLTDGDMSQGLTVCSSEPCTFDGFSTD